MRDVTLIVLAVSAACGNVSTEHPDAKVDTVDGSPWDGPAPDGPVEIDAPQAACDLDQPFGEPVLLANVNSADLDIDGYISHDGLTLYFASTRAGGLGERDIWTASRASTGDDFGTPTRLPNVNTADHEGAPFVSADERTLYLSRTPVSGGNWDIYVATRGSTAAAFGTPELLLNVNDSSANDVATNINEAGTTLYMSSSRSGDWDILRATRADTSGPFGAPTPLGELNVSAAEDYGPVLTGDELTVYFESVRSGSLGCYDVYMARRSTTADGFGTPTRVAELSTASCEYPTWVSADGCQIILASNRSGGLGSYDLWIASRP